MTVTRCDSAQVSVLLRDSASWDVGSMVGVPAWSLSAPADLLPRDAPILPVGEQHEPVTRPSSTADSLLVSTVAPPPPATPASSSQPITPPASTSPPQNARPRALARAREQLGTDLLSRDSTVSYDLKGACLTGGGTRGRGEQGESRKRGRTSARGGHDERGRRGGGKEVVVSMRKRRDLRRGGVEPRKKRTREKEAESR